ncbi:MAG: Uncharacterized protein FD123_2574 [Bacteroidetes bacterium]|nr:MAG: Uncharacterized protein FD123_2574 [Bacteroidota bacterium]
MNLLNKPFGENSCEDEKRLLLGEYEKYYFRNKRFETKILDRSTYLVVGRRGTGKSSLIEYFSFNELHRHYRCIDVNEPQLYQVVLEKVARLLEENALHTSRRARLIWKYVIWALIFREYEHADERISLAGMMDFGGGNKFSASRIILTLIQSLISKYTGLNIEEVFRSIEEKLSSDVFLEAQLSVLECSRTDETIIALDSIEDYPVGNSAMMEAISALVEYASEFNSEFSNKGLHLKVFLSSEIFPHLLSSVIPNPLKVVRDPLVMHWRPKELLRFVCWRWYLHLQQTGKLEADFKIDFERPADVLKKLWEPYFGHELVNGSGSKEPSFAFLLRHTQLRPRQLVIICNQLFRIMGENGYKSDNPSRDVARAIAEVQAQLAIEVINSYKKIHHNVDRILNALTGLPMHFRGRELDRVAKITGSQWENEQYSPYNFRAICAELGIIGRVRNFDHRTGIIAADFEYFLEDNLVITDRDDCVFHPLFFNKYNVQHNVPNAIIYPFPDHPDYKI